MSMLPRTIFPPPRRMPRRSRLLAALALATLLPPLDGCRREPPASTPPAVVVALAVHPVNGSETGGVRYPVEVAARYSNTLSFRVAGKLLERSVRLGDLVHKGQVVARLDPADAERQEASAKAALDAAESRLVFAREQLDRDTAQSAQNLISAVQLEQTRDSHNAALAARNQAADQLVIAHNALGYDSLIADHDGVISSENADTGQVLAAGQAVYGLAWSGETDVLLDAAASEMNAISVGQAARVSFLALPGRRFDADVREISPAADPQSRTYRIKLTLHDAGAAVRLGMSGDAVLAPREEPSAGAALFRVPATAMFHRGKDPAVWVIRGSDSKLELRAVDVLSFSERSALVTRGLRDGDTVVLAGVHTVHEGELVTAVKPLFHDEDAAARADAEPSS